MATTKEDPDSFFDVSVKGTFHILEACRKHEIKQFILLGGDAAVGIWFHPHPNPIDESHPLQAYPGNYAFSKVLEETMTNQFHIQYGLPFTILRSSWVFENDDLLNHFSLLKNVNPAEPGHGFGNPGPDTLDLVRSGQERLPVLLDATGIPLRRHIVHIDDLIHALDKTIDNPKALNETFNIAAPEPFDYRHAADYLSSLTEIPTVDIPCPDYHSFEIDITKARRHLDYHPRNNFQTMADRALAARNLSP
jgi:UDP-glucose 4-epimerase